MASKGLQFHGVVLDSEGSRFDAVIENGVETLIYPFEDVDNSRRLRRLYAVAND